MCSVGGEAECGDSQCGDASAACASDDAAAADRPLPLALLRGRRRAAAFLAARRFRPSRLRARGGPEDGGACIVLLGQPIAACGMLLLADDGVPAVLDVVVRALRHVHLRDLKRGGQQGQGVARVGGKGARGEISTKCGNSGGERVPGGRKRRPSGGVPSWVRPAAMGRP